MNSVAIMSDDAAAREDQAIIQRISERAMQQLAAGRSAEEVSRDVQAHGLAKATCDALVEHLQQRWRQIAAAPQANAEVYFRTKYPQLRPVRSAPWLFNIHGIGAGFYNERDRDPATGTVVKTHCFSLLFFPVLALAAYRVYPRGSGWTLIGKVPLSGFAKCWNVCVLLAIAGWIGLAIWEDSDSGPAAVAAGKLAQADQAANAGQLLEASQLYREVARSRTEHAAEAREQCVRLVQRQEIENMPMPEVVKIFEQVLAARLDRIQSQTVRQRGAAIARQRANDDPRAAMELLQCFDRFRRFN